MPRKTIPDIIHDGSKKVKPLDTQQHIRDINEQTRQVKGQLIQIRNTTLSLLGRLDALIGNLSPE